MTETLQSGDASATTAPTVNHYANKNDILHGIVFGHSVAALCGEIVDPQGHGNASTSGLGTGRAGAPTCATCSGAYERFAA